MRLVVVGQCLGALILLWSNSLPPVFAEGDPPGHLKPLGSHRPAEGDVEVLDEVPHPIDFHERFVKPGKPVLFRGAARNSRAFRLWNDAYLAEKFGSLVMMSEHGKKENRSEGSSYVQLKTFLGRYNGSDEYMVETLPPKMHGKSNAPGYRGQLDQLIHWCPVAEILIPVLWYA